MGSMANEAVTHEAMSTILRAMEARRDLLQQAIDMMKTLEATDVFDLKATAKLIALTKAAKKRNPRTERAVRKAYKLIHEKKK